MTFIPVVNDVKYSLLGACLVLTWCALFAFEPVGCQVCVCFMCALFMIVACLLGCFKKSKSAQKIFPMF